MVVELRLLVVTIPRAAPVALVDNDFLELVAWLLWLRLHFFLTSVLRDSGRVPWRFYPGKKTKVSMIPNYHYHLKSHSR